MMILPRSVVPRDLQSKNSGNLSQNACHCAEHKTRKNLANDKATCTHRVYAIATAKITLIVSANCYCAIHDALVFDGLSLACRRDAHVGSQNECHEYKRLIGSKGTCHVGLN